MTMKNTPKKQWFEEKNRFFFSQMNLVSTQKLIYHTQMSAITFVILQVYKYIYARQILNCLV